MLYNPPTYLIHIMNKQSILFSAGRMSIRYTIGISIYRRLPFSRLPSTKQQSLIREYTNQKSGVEGIPFPIPIPILVSPPPENMVEFVRRKFTLPECTL